MPLAHTCRNVLAVADDLLADWTFKVREISAGVYRGSAEGPRGRSAGLTRGDPDEVMALLRERAAAIAAGDE